MEEGSAESKELHAAASNVSERAVANTSPTTAKKEERSTAARAFFAAQTLLENGKPTRAASRLSALLGSLQGLQVSRAALDDPAEKGSWPPLAIVGSAACNALGEVHVDMALESTSEEAQVHTRKAVEHFNHALQYFSDNCSAALSLAHIKCSDGNLEAALSLYAQVAALPLPPRQARRKSRGWQQDWVFDAWRRCIPIACYHQAHLLSRLGKHEDAIPIIRRFGCCYRLAPDVWHPAQLEKVPARGPSQVLDSPRLLRDVVPDELLEVLRRGLSPDAAYWNENDYSSREYFSWYYELENRPTNAVEALIKQVLVPALAGCGGESLVAAEWWAHKRRLGNDLGHQLHFDMEEHTLEQTGRILHPAVSVVVYLSGPAGGPTLVLDQTVDGAMAERGWLVQPQCGSVMLFPGDRLHGVLPSKPGSCDASEPRLTLMVGLWSSVDFAPGDRGPVGPQSPVPADKTWPSALQLPAEMTAAASRLPAEEGPVLLVSPVWEALRGEAVAGLQLPKGVDQRFFTKEAAPWRKRVLRDHGVDDKAEGESSKRKRLLS